MCLNKSSIEISTLDGHVKKLLTPTYPSYVTTTTTGSRETTNYTITPSLFSTTGWAASSVSLGSDVLSKYIKNYEKEVIGDVKIELKEPFKGQHVVTCKSRDDLASDRILRTLSAIKGKLMLDIAPVHVQKIECRMTPEVRKNLVKAGKRLKMYGKKQPVIARFDEYGNRLPDEINLPDSYHGINVEIINPDDYGIFYLEMRAIEFPSLNYKPYSVSQWEDIPIL